jgi:HEAT repeat protein
MKDRSVAVRRVAVRALGKLGGDEVVAVLGTLLKGDDVVLRREAALALLRRGQRIREAFTLLGSEELDWRIEAVMTLDVADPRNGEAAEALKSALTDPAKEVRYQAAALLLRKDRHVDDAVVAWLRASVEIQRQIDREAELIHSSPARDSTRSNRRADPVGDLRAKALPGLVRALKDRDATVRVLAAGHLGRLGTKAKTAVPALRAAQSDSDAGVRAAAAEALEKIDGQGVTDKRD